MRFDLTLHAYMLTQSGIPVIYSGDEIGQENDYTYHEDPKKWEDSRYLHRGAFRWDKAELRHTPGTIQEKIFDGLRTLEKIRGSHPVFDADAACRTVDTWDDSILGLIKEKDGEKLVALFNFSRYDKVAWVNEEDGMYRNLVTGQAGGQRGADPRFRFLLADERAGEKNDHTGNRPDGRSFQRRRFPLPESGQLKPGEEGTDPGGHRTDRLPALRICPGAADEAEPPDRRGGTPD